MTQKSGKGGAAKAGSGKVVAQSHNVGKGGFQKAKLGGLQAKQAFLGKKDIKPVGKAGPQGGKPQKPTHGNNQNAKGGKGLQAKKGKIDDEDEDDEDDEDDDEDMDDDEEMEDVDEDDDDEDDGSDDDELSGDSEEDVPKKGEKQVKAAVIPKSILKGGPTPKSGDEKVPKLVPIANAAKGGNQAQAAKPNQKANAKNGKQEGAQKAETVVAKVKANERQRTASGSDEAFKLIANTECEALTASQRTEFETRVKRIASSTVFVKGLHRRCTEDDLRRLAKDVLSVRLPSHEKKGSKSARTRGYAFLEFKDEAIARRNVDFLNKEAKLMNSEGQACKLEASVSSAGGYIMAADDWNVGSLYVSGLPEQVTENDVQALFERDEVVTVVLPRNRSTGCARGAAHVRFRSADSAIRQFDAARSKLLRGEFSVKAHTLSLAFSSRKTLKRERAEHEQKAAAQPVAITTGKKAADSKPVTPSQTPKAAVVQTGVSSAAKSTPLGAKGNAAVNKSLNESITKKTASNTSLSKKPETPVSAQKGTMKRKFGDEEAKRKAKVAKRDEDDEDDDDEEDDE